MKRSAKLVALDAEPFDPNVIKALEDVLEVAREGKLSSVAIAMVYRDGSGEHCWSKAPSLSCLIGSVERMKYAIIRFSEE